MTMTHEGGRAADSRIRYRNTSAGSVGKDRHHVVDLEQSGWLTTVLRPAGVLDQPALDRLSAALGHVAVSTDMVIIDLTAAEVTAPAALAQTMRAPARQLQQAGGCLLVVGAPAGLMAELGRATVAVTAFGRGSLPLPAA
jgi:hypothetical protein